PLGIRRELIPNGLEYACDVGALSRSRLRPRTSEPEQLVDDHRNAIQAAPDGSDRPLGRGVAVQFARKHAQAGRNGRERAEDVVRDATRELLQLRRSRLLDPPEPLND